MKFYVCVLISKHHSTDSLKSVLRKQGSSKLDTLRTQNGFSKTCYVTINNDCTKQKTLLRIIDGKWHRDTLGGKLLSCWLWGLQRLEFRLATIPLLIKYPTSN